MAKRGKTLTFYLMDGVATGRIKCTLANWTGVVITRETRDVRRENRPRVSYNKLPFSNYTLKLYLSVQ